MFEKILYPTDFSDVSKKPLNYLKQLMDAGAKEVIVLHVIDERKIEAIALYGTGGSYVLIDKMREEAKRELKKCGFEVKVRIETGVPLTEILRVEQEEGVSVTVIGSHGKSNVKEMLLGSVSEKVIRKSERPVLFIKR